MRVTVANTPHVYHAVSELAAVTSVEKWSNNKVRAVGRLREVDVTRFTAILESVGEPDGTFRVAVNVEAVGQVKTLENNIVVVFGELEIESTWPSIKAKIVRECNNLALQEHSEAVEAVRHRFPRL